MQGVYPRGTICHIYMTQVLTVVSDCMVLFFAKKGLPTQAYPRFQRRIYACAVVYLV